MEEKEIKEKLQTNLFRDDSSLNFCNVLKKLVEYNIENDFVFNEDKKQYMLKDFSKDSERLDLLFKELYPDGFHIRKKILFE